MDRVNITVTTTAKGPAPQEVMGMYLIEVMRNGVPETKQGYLYREKITNKEMILQLFVNALHIANKLSDEFDTMECFVDEPFICSAFSNKWIDNWQSNEWKTAKNTEVANAETWKMLIEKIEQSTKRVIVLQGDKSSYRNWMRMKLESKMKELKWQQAEHKRIYGGN